MLRAVFSHYLLRKDWNHIAENNGFVFLTDEIHLNRKGALVVADLVDGFLAGFR